MDDDSLPELWWDNVMRRGSWRKFKEFECSVRWPGQFTFVKYEGWGQRLMKHSPAAALIGAGVDARQPSQFHHPAQPSNADNLTRPLKTKRDLEHENLNLAAVQTRVRSTSVCN